MGVTIEIDGWEPTRKFFGGEIIRGSVIFVNKSSTSKMLSHDLVITFTGKAESHWKEQRKNVGHQRQYLTSTVDSEVYFVENVMLQSRDSLAETLELRPGRVEYPFQFQLPFGLPESYKSDHGSVTYWAEVPYSKSWKIDNCIKLEFLMGAHLDLDLCPREWSQPAEFTMTKSFWWGMGKVEAKILLPSRSYLPLDEINFTVEVINHSRCYLKKIRVYFCKVTTYYAKESEFKEGARLSKIKCKAVYPRGTATIQGSIAVPNVPPTELGGCALIQPEYGIMIKVIATTFGKIVRSAVLEGRVPILIGTGRSIPIPAGVTPTSLIRPVTVLRRMSEFTSKRVVLDPKDNGNENSDRFNNLAD